MGLLGSEIPHRVDHKFALHIKLCKYVGIYKVIFIILQTNQLLNSIEFRQVIKNKRNKKLLFSAVNKINPLKSNLAKFTFIIHASLLLEGIWNTKSFNVLFSNPWMNKDSIFEFRLRNGDKAFCYVGSWHRISNRMYTLMCWYKCAYWMKYVHMLWLQIIVVVGMRNAFVDRLITAINSGILEVFILLLGIYFYLFIIMRIAKSK